MHSFLEHLRFAGTGMIDNLQSGSDFQVVPQAGLANLRRRLHTKWRPRHSLRRRGPPCSDRRRRFPRRTFSVFRQIVSPESHSGSIYERSPCLAARHEESWHRTRQVTSGRPSNYASFLFRCVAAFPQPTTSLLHLEGKSRLASEDRRPRARSGRVSPAITTRYPASVEGALPATRV